MMSTCAPSDTTYTPSVPFWHNKTCTPFALTQPGGQFGSETVSCGCAQTAYLCDEKNGCSPTSSYNSNPWCWGNFGASVMETVSGWFGSGASAPSGGWGLSFGGLSFGRRRLSETSSIGSGSATTFQTFRGQCGAPATNGWQTPSNYCATPPPCPVTPRTCDGNY